MKNDSCLCFFFFFFELFNDCKDTTDTISWRA